MSELRQKLLVLHLHTPDLNSSVVAWAMYDGSGEKRHTTGDSETPPYNSVMEGDARWLASDSVSTTIPCLPRHGISYFISQVRIHP